MRKTVFINNTLRRAHRRSTHSDIHTQMIELRLNISVCTEVPHSQDGHQNKVCTNIVTRAAIINIYMFVKKIYKVLILFIYIMIISSSPCECNVKFSVFVCFGFSVSLSNLTDTKICICNFVTTIYRMNN